jgi:hypothetical protein
VQAGNGPIRAPHLAVETAALPRRRAPCLSLPQPDQDLAFAPVWGRMGRGTGGEERAERGGGERAAGHRPEC